LLFVGFVLASALLGSPHLGPAAGQDRPPAPSTLSAVYRRPLGNDPGTLDPPRISDTYGRSVAEQIFDGLVQFDQTLTVSPALARFWKASRDGLVWTFYLRQGVRFHHGRELTSEDVVYSLTRLLDPKLRSGAAEQFSMIRGAREFREGKVNRVEGLRAVDRHTVEVSLTEAFTPFVSVLAVGQAKIVPRDLAESQGEAFGIQPVGTGPYKFSRWERGKEIALVANTDYYGGAPQLARVLYRIFPGESSDQICHEFEQGNLEESPVPPVCRSKVGNPRYLHVQRPTFSVRFYGFNTHFKPLSDVRVRMAIAHALDRERILQEIFAGRFQAARSILPPGMAGHNQSIKTPAHDLARARALLRAAGYPDGKGIPPIPIWSSVRSPRIESELEAIKAQLRAIGIQAETNFETDWPTFSKRLVEGRLPMFLYAWHAELPDPDSFLFQLFHSKSPRNPTGYANPVVDALLVQARREKDPLRRREIYQRVEPLILEDAPVIPVWHYAYERLFQGYVRNVEVSGLGEAYMPLRRIWLEDRR
jgi:oligopeptide transport system substrate-binding protein